MIALLKLSRDSRTSSGMAGPVSTAKYKQAILDDVSYELDACVCCRTWFTQRLVLMHQLTRDVLLLMMRCQAGHEKEHDAILVVAKVMSAAIHEDVTVVADVLELLSRDHDDFFKPIFETVVDYLSNASHELLHHR